MAGTSNPYDSAQAAQDLQGYGTALTGGLIDKNGQTFGGGKDVDSYLATLRKYDPNAHLEDQTNSEGAYSGSLLKYDINKLPPGALQAITGPKGGVELSDPNSHWNDGDTTRIIDPSKINTDPIYGRSTSQTNIYKMPDKGRDVGFWGPLVMAAVTAGAGSGLIGGFEGMTDAAAQGLVSGATGSGLEAGGAGMLGLSPSQSSSLTQQVGGQLMNGGKPSGSSIIGAGLNYGLGQAGSALGMTPAEMMLARLGMGAARQQIGKP